MFNGFFNCVFHVFSGMGKVSMCQCGVMRGFFMFARFMEFSGFFVVFRCFRVMFCGLVMMFSCRMFISHKKIFLLH